MVCELSVAEHNGRALLLPLPSPGGGLAGAASGTADSVAHSLSRRVPRLRHRASETDAGGVGGGVRYQRAVPVCVFP